MHSELLSIPFTTRALRFVPSTLLRSRCPLPLFAHLPVDTDSVSWLHVPRTVVSSAIRLADAKAIATVETSPTLANMCLAFDEVMKKADGLPLWSLSANAHSNLVSFNHNMKPAMKERYPKSNDAVKVLELARDNGHLLALARYAANKKAEEDDDGPLETTSSSITQWASLTLNLGGLLVHLTDVPVIEGHHGILLGNDVLGKG
jgi:hypothetical protein